MIRYKLRTVSITAREPATGRADNAADAERVLRSIYASLDQDREHFVILALDTQLGIRGFKVVATGAQDATNVDPRTLFRDALLLGASSLVVSHNHPSGNPRPSGADVEITKVLRAGGELLNLPIVDHIILGDTGRYYSFGQQGHFA